MSVTYRAIDWNRQKRLYDLTLAAVVGLGLSLFIFLSLTRSPHFTAETLLLRGTSVAAFLLLHVILAIGPLCRLDPRFLPLLYNRRHLGVTMFLLALAHGVLATVQFHALGDENPLVSLFTAYRQDYAPARPVGAALAHFPFEPFGVTALAILLVMAATSHDFWLRYLGASFWKTLHLGVYAAYGLLVVHVALGVLQSERHPGLVLLTVLGFTALAGLHLAAAWKEARLDHEAQQATREGFVVVARADELVEGRGKVVRAGPQRLALFRHQDRLFATSNVCRHQGGPIGEGRILDGCITCPWHGWNYQPEDGCSPPPFTERLDTHDVRLIGDEVWVRPIPNPAGTRCAGAARPDSAPPVSHTSAAAFPSP